MADPIATAFVLVRPVLTGFQAELTAQLTGAINAAQRTVKPIVVPVTTVGGVGGVGAAVAEANVLAGAQVEVGETALVSAAAERAYQRALAEGGVILAGQTVENEALAFAQAEVAGTAGAAGAGITSVGGAARRAKKDMLDAKNESNLFRGALIGLSRVTPVTVFGLGLVGTAAIAVGLSVKHAIGLSADFEKQLNIFQAVSGATAAQMKEVAQAAEELGADLTLPATTAGDAAHALTQLAKAGLSVEDALAGVKGVLQLGTAASISAEQAADIAASAINAFELGGDQIPHIADLLAGAANAAQGDITDFAAALSQASSVAFQSGLTIEQLTGIFTELARSGLKGADMGTSVRTTLLRLTPTTKEAAAFTEALGVKLDRSRSIGEQLPEVIDAYKSALDKLLPTQRTMVENQIVGQDSIRAFDILVRKGSGGLKEATDASNKEGEAARIAAAKTQGLAGAWENLKNQLDKTALTLGDTAKGPLTLIVTVTAEAVSAVDKLFHAFGRLGSIGSDDKGDTPWWMGPTKGETESFIGEKLSDAKSSFGRFWNSFTGEALKAEKAANKRIVDAHRASQGTESGAFGAFGVTALRAVSPLGRRDPTFSREVTAAEQRIRDRVDAVTQVAAAIKKGTSDSRVRLQGAIDVARAESNLTGLVSAQRALIRRDNVELLRLERVLRSGLGDAKAIGAQIRELKIEMANTLNDIFAVLTDPAFNPTFANIEIQGINADATESLIDNINNDKLRVAATQQALAQALLGGANESTLFDLRKQVADAQRQLATDQRSAADAAKTAATSAAAATKDAADAAEHALDVQEENLRFFADAADNQGKAEQKLLALLLKRLHDAKGNQEKINKARADYRAEQEKAAQSLRDSVQQSLDLQLSRLDTRLATALQTAGTADEKRIYNAQIKLLQIQEKNQLALARQAGLTTKKGRDALKEVEATKQAILAVREKIKDLTNTGGGFTLNDLWKSAAQQLTDFGSNISFAPMTPGQNVQSVASNILSQKPDKLTGVIASKADKQFMLTETTNDILTDIRNLLDVPGVQGGTPWRRRNALTDTPGTAADAAKYAVAGVGGM